MTFKETMAKLFSTSEGTYYKWKRENRPIILLLEKYFTRDDIEEFLEDGIIKKLEKNAVLHHILDTNLRCYQDFFMKIYNPSIINDVKDIDSYKSTIIYKYFDFLNSNKSNLFALIQSEQFITKLIQHLLSDNNISKNYYYGDELIQYLACLDKSTQYSIYHLFILSFNDYHKFNELNPNPFKPYEHSIHFNYNSKIKKLESNEEFLSIFSEMNNKIEENYQKIENKLFKKIV